MTTRTARARSWALAVLLAVVASFAVGGFQASRTVPAAVSVAASHATYEATAPQRAIGPVHTPPAHEILPYAIASTPATVDPPSWQQTRLTIVEPPKTAERLPGTGVRAPPFR
ncbi:hypothetical protein [Fodinicola acaciae]|uniref:hypothetical protein n=1 Tax=Fodinicola acaciae TaxID=2681555 RepID=UPI0013D7DDEC|nr:hypothetical protein [Fodinicola acaciae]